MISLSKNHKILTALFFSFLLVLSISSTSFADESSVENVNTQLILKEINDDSTPKFETKAVSQYGLLYSSS